MSHRNRFAVVAPKLATFETVAELFDAWQAAAGEFEENEADPILAGVLERQLHATLKADYLGDIFNIGEYAVWVDQHTPDGRVNFRTMLDGSNPL